jgi:hypothetical protein
MCTCQPTTSPPTRLQCGVLESQKAAIGNPAALHDALQTGCQQQLPRAPLTARLLSFRSSCPHLCLQLCCNRSALTMRSLSKQMHTTHPAPLHAPKGSICTACSGGEQLPKTNSSGQLYGRPPDCHQAADAMAFTDFAHPNTRVDNPSLNPTQPCIPLPNNPAPQVDG